jgi:hypothetical protein
MSSTKSRKAATSAQSNGARQRRTPDLSPEVKEVLKMLKALEDQPEDDAGQEQTRGLGRSVVTD